MLHAFWVQVVRCRSCRQVTEAHPHYKLAYEAEGKRQWAFCRNCHDVHEMHRDEKSFHCRTCRTKNVIEEGVVNYGEFSCPSCATTERLIDVAARVSMPPQWRLFALETVPLEGNSRRCLMTDRTFQAATDDDRERVHAARRALLRRREADGLRWVPRRAIPTDGRSDDRLLDYGYRNYQDLFNPRQLLHLSVLAEAIARTKGQERNALALAFSDHLTTNCMLTHYAFGWRRLAPLFSIRAIDTSHALSRSTRGWTARGAAPFRTPSAKCNVLSSSPANRPWPTSTAALSVPARSTQTATAVSF